MSASSSRTILAADVGGTHARLGWVELPNDPSKAPSLLHHLRYRCAEFSGLDAIVRRFMADAPRQPHAVGIACAGLRVDDRIISPNLPWELDLVALRAACGDLPLAISNDFEALARATRWLPPSECKLLCGKPCPADESRPLLVLGPGTGLGASIRVRVAANHEFVIATEAGHAGYAPADADEAAVLSHLQSKMGHVATESLLSGPGLLRIYQTLCALRGTSANGASPEAVSSMAEQGTDACAVDAVRLFWNALGNVVGNLVLQTGSFGGVLLAGGVLPRIEFGRVSSAFEARLCAKGSMQPAMQNVPVYQIEHGELAILGAAMAVPAGA